MTSPNLSNAMLHESTVRNINQSGSDVHIELDDVSFDGRTTDDNRKPVLVTVNNVTEILRDSVPVNSIYSEMEDGELVSLDQEENGVTLLIEWISYTPKKRITVSYDLVGGIMSLKSI